MATTTTIRGITYNSGNTFTTAYTGSWHGSADGGQGSGTVTTGKTVTFYEDRTGWAEWYYYPILCKGGGFNGGDYFWTDTSVFPYAKVTVNFDSGGGSRTYTWGTGGNFPSVTKTGYKHTGWKIDGVTYSATSAVANFWISERNNQTKTATAVWEAQASPISSATPVTLSKTGTANSTVSWNAYSSSFTYVLSASSGNASATATYTNCSGNVSKTLGFSKDWIDAITTAKSASVTITLTTKSGNTVLGTSTKAITVTLPNGIDPTVTFDSGYPTKSAVTANPFTVPVINLDSIRVKWIYTPWKANANNSGSPINSGTVTVGSSTQSDTSGDITSPILTIFGARTVSVTATDKRGNSNSVSTTVGVYEYYLPSVTSTFNKTSNVYKLVLGGKFASVNGQNTTRTLKLDVYKNGSKVNVADISLNSHIASTVTLGSSTPYNDYYAISGDYEIDITDVDGQGTDISDISSETYEFRVTAQDRVGSNVAKSVSGITVLTFGAGGTDITANKPMTIKGATTIDGGALKLRDDTQDGGGRIWLYPQNGDNTNRMNVDVFGGNFRVWSSALGGYVTQTKADGYFNARNGLQVGGETIGAWRCSNGTLTTTAWGAATTSVKVTLPRGVHIVWIRFALNSDTQANRKIYKQLNFRVVSGSVTYGLNASQLYWDDEDSASPAVIRTISQPILVTSSTAVISPTVYTGTAGVVFNVAMCAIYLGKQ